LFNDERIVEGKMGTQIVADKNSAHERASFWSIIDDR
jgi:hypothetical protein